MSRKRPARSRRRGLRGKYRGSWLTYRPYFSPRHPAAHYDCVALVFSSRDAEVLGLRDARPGELGQDVGERVSGRAPLRRRRAERGDAAAQQRGHKASAALYINVHRRFNAVLADLALVARVVVGGVFFDDREGGVEGSSLVARPAVAAGEDVADAGGNVRRVCYGKLAEAQ